MANNEVRAIVPGRLGKGMRGATLCAVTVERNNDEGPLALAGLAMKKAEKTHRNFHAAYSTLCVLVALPEDEPDSTFEAVWEALALSRAGQRPH